MDKSTAELIVSDVEKTVTVKRPTGVRMELTLEDAVVLAAILWRIRGGADHEGPRPVFRMSQALYGAGILGKSLTDNCLSGTIEFSADYEMLMKMTAESLVEDISHRRSYWDPRYSVRDGEKHG